MTTTSPTPDILTLLDRPDTTVAVVGASDDLSKYGARIYRDLKSKGFRVFAVNPTRDTVDGDPCWPTLADLPEAPTIVDFVVPPRQTRRVLEECLELGYTNVWIQPGAEDEEVLSFLDQHGFNHLTNACIMVEARTTR
ncbi:MAG: CoA-binding protein [Acidimicrobiia bacterium]|nr:CoA-binding protein [Acidimicrobiia bacterium]